jgi:hypothetical protein
MHHPEWFKCTRCRVKYTSFFVKGSGKLLRLSYCFPEHFRMQPMTTCLKRNRGVHKPLKRSEETRNDINVPNGGKKRKDRDGSDMVEKAEKGRRVGVGPNDREDGREKGKRLEKASMRTSSWHSASPGSASLASTTPARLPLTPPTLLPTLKIRLPRLSSFNVSADLGIKRAPSCTLDTPHN